MCCVSNILSGPLCELAPRFAALVRAGGDLVLAGLMEERGCRRDTRLRRMV